MNSLLAGTSLPMRIEVILFASIASSISTFLSFRVSGFIVVSHNCFASISPTLFVNPVLPRALANSSRRPVVDCHHRVICFHLRTDSRRTPLPGDGRDRFKLLTACFPRDFPALAGRPSLAMHFCMTPLVKRKR